MQGCIVLDFAFFWSSPWSATSPKERHRENETHKYSTSYHVCNLSKRQCRSWCCSQQIHNLDPTMLDLSDGPMVRHHRHCPFKKGNILNSLHTNARDPDAIRALDLYTLDTHGPTVLLPQLLARCCNMHNTTKGTYVSTSGFIP